MANYLVTDEQLQAIANKIREKTGGTEGIEFVSEFVSEIEKLTDTRDADAVAGDIRSGKTAYVNKTKVTGNVPAKSSSDVSVSGNVVTTPAGIYDSQVQKTVGTSKAAATYNTSTSDQTIASGQYLAGAQTIKAVTTSNIDAGNIKTGVVVKVGDANSATRIKNVTGTYTSDANATASQILSGKTAYVNGSKVTGNIASKAAATFNTSTSDQSISSGQYLSGAQTIKAVTTSNLSAANIKSGVNVKVGDANSSGRIVNITGTYKSTASFSNSTTTYRCPSSDVTVSNKGEATIYTITFNTTTTRLLRVGMPADGSNLRFRGSLYVSGTTGYYSISCINTTGSSQKLIANSLTGDYVTSTISVSV